MRFLPHILILVTALTAAFGVAPAGAVTAANTPIVNSASVTYFDGSGTRSASASVTVMVTTVDSVATVDTPPNQTSPYTGSSAQQLYTFTLTASGNGPATYAVAATVDAFANTSLPVAAPSVNAISLGATVTTAGSTATTLAVPSDGVTNTAVNGIAVGSRVVVGGEVRTVTAVADPAAGTAAITLDRPLSAPPAAGVSVFEQKSVVVDVLAGTIANPASAVTVTVSLKVTGRAGTGAAQVVGTFTTSSATLTKYVRNVTSPTTGNILGTGGRSFTVNGTTATYYTSGVTGTRGDVLEYLLVAANTGTVPAAGCTVRDTLPTQFVAPQTDVFGPGLDILYVDDTLAETRLTLKSDGDNATLDGSTLTIAIGAIGAGKDAKVVYRVTINQ